MKSNTNWKLDQGTALPTYPKQRGPTPRPARIHYGRILQADIRTRFEGGDVASLAATRNLVARLGIRPTGAVAGSYSPAEAGACPLGWIPIFERTVRRLLKNGWNRRLAMIHQKGGRALLVIEHGTRAMRSILDRFEARSAKTCGVCGTGAELQTPGLCGPHALMGWPAMACLIAPECWGKRRRCWEGPGPRRRRRRLHDRADQEQV